jgi:hypothetical protein
MSLQTQPPSLLAVARGFTPVIDVLVQETGLITAAVYGVVWRYCQMEEGVCRASVARMARRLGIGRQTVHRHLKRLCELGYLEDTTPGRKCRPHVYRDTGESRIAALAASANPGAAAPHVDPLPEAPSVASMGSQKPHRDAYDHTPCPAEERHCPAQSQRCPAQGHQESSDESTTETAPAEAAGARHPAIRAFRHAAHRYPAKSWYQDVVRTVGEGPADLQFWGRVVKAWVGCGYNPLNVKGMLDCFKQRKIPSTTGRGGEILSHPGRSKLDATMAAGLRILQEEGEL